MNAAWKAFALARGDWWFASPAAKLRKLFIDPTYRRRARLPERMVNLSIAPHGKALLVTGDTKQAKDDLKALGGRWNGSLSGWTFPQSKQDEILATLRAKHQVDSSAATGATSQSSAAAPAATSSGPAAAAPSTNANATLTVAPHKNAILVTGDTKAVKDTLKALDGRWNGPLVGWVFQGSRRDEVVELLRKDPTNTVHVQEQQQTAPKELSKRPRPTPEEAEAHMGSRFDAALHGSSKQPAAPKRAAPKPAQKRKKERPWVQDGMIDLERYANARMSGEYKRLRAADPHAPDSDSDDFGPLNSNIYGMM